MQEVSKTKSFCYRTVESGINDPALLCTLRTWKCLKQICMRYGINPLTVLLVKRFREACNVLIFRFIFFFLQIFLRESDYIIKSRKDFFWKIKEKQVPKGYQSILIDAKTLFTKILLDGTIDIILSRIYVKHKLKTSITRSEMKELLILRTENVHFTFDIAMGSLQ